VRLVFNKTWKDRTPQSWVLYGEDQWIYRKEVRKTSKEAWMTFCNSVNALPI
jgi:hypothetical protein